MPRTPNDVLQAAVGRIMFENATLVSENEALREKLIEVGRMLPAAELEKLKLKIVDEGAAPTPLEAVESPEA